MAKKIVLAGGSGFWEKTLLITFRIEIMTLSFCPGSLRRSKRESGMSSGMGAAWVHGHLNWMDLMRWLILRERVSIASIRKK